MRGDRLEALIVLALATGMRQGELLALHWDDVDLDAGWLRAVGSPGRAAGAGMTIEEPTKPKSRRRVELTTLGIDALRAHRPAQLESAELPQIRFHDLRHTAATLMLARGVHPKVAGDMLGHSTIAMTMDLYSHVSPTVQHEAADALDSLLG